MTQKNGEITVSPVASLTPGTDLAWTFTYCGVFEGSPGGALRLASIDEPVSTLLYRGDWFPVVGDGTQRSTAEIHVHVPTGDQVLSSGLIGTPHADANGQTVFDFNWQHPGFPGTVIAGKFQSPVEAPGSPIQVYLLSNSSRRSIAAQPSGQEIAATAAKQYSELAAQFGPTETGQLNIVELPNDTLPAASAPEGCSDCRQSTRNGGLSPVAGEYDCPSVVGRRSQPGIGERCMDHQRDVPLCRTRVPESHGDARNFSRRNPECLRQRTCV